MVIRSNGSSFPSTMQPTYKVASGYRRTRSAALLVIALFCLYSHSKEVNQSTIARILCSTQETRPSRRVGGRFLCGTASPSQGETTETTETGEEVVTPPAEEGSGLDEVFPPAEEEYQADETANMPGGSENIAYVLTVASCPEDTSHPNLDDPGDAFYDAAAIVKQSVCNCTTENPDAQTIYGTSFQFNLCYTLYFFS